MKTDLSPELIERISLLKEKYAVMGQDMISYLDGLLYADYLTYWDYTKLDILLNLQTPRTPLPDEQIFIIYHQITELYFKLILHAIEQVAGNSKLTSSFFLLQMKRVNSYFRNLVYSFEIMIDGMDRDQFLSFRMALLPASGFQSAQYRMIEICSTDMHLLTAEEEIKSGEKELSIEELNAKLYWKQGATELATGKKTLTLRQFEEKYYEQFVSLGKKYEKKNLYRLFNAIPESDENWQALKEELRQFDHYANVDWPLMHYRSAVRYLQRNPEDIRATGGTNWQKYLPPRHQMIVFFPKLWDEEERKNWGVKAFREAAKG